MKDNIIDFEKIKVAGVTKEQIDTLTSIFEKIRECANINKEDSKLANQEMQKCYMDIEKWVQENKLSTDKLMKIVSKLPKEVTEGFNIVPISVDDCMPFADLYSEELEIEENLIYYLKNKKNECKVSFNKDTATITSFKKIDLEDEELNRLLNLYELDMKTKVPELFLKLVICENLKSYSRSTNNFGI